jgi:hypothetical protein
MSYLNINYSSLEDAWGANFEKKKSKKQQHPSCYLYDKKKQKANKPYKTIANQNTYRPMYTDDDVDHIKYHGYKDNNRIDSNMDKLRKYKLKYPYMVEEENKYVQEEDTMTDDDADEYNINPYSEEVFDEYIPNKQAKSRSRTIKLPLQIQQNPYDNINRGYAKYEANSKQFYPRKINTAKCKQPDNTLINYSFLQEVDEEDENNIEWPQHIRKQVDANFIKEDDIIRKQTNTTPSSVHRKKHQVIFEEDPQYPIKKKQVLPSSKQNVRDRPIHMDDEEQEEQDFEEQDFEEDDEFGIYLKKLDKNNSKRRNEIEDEYNSVLQSVYEEQQNVHEERRPVGRRIQKACKTVVKQNSQEKIYLDFLVYTISGILLIFILEQFIQIGMKIKRL